MNYLIKIYFDCWSTSMGYTEAVTKKKELRFNSICALLILKHSSRIRLH